MVRDNWKEIISSNNTPFSVTKATKMVRTLVKIKGEMICSMYTIVATLVD